jgi:hypothetical protein
MSDASGSHADADLVVREVPWSAPEPGEVPELRSALVAHLRTDVAHITIRGALEEGKASVRPPGRPDAAARILLGEECYRLSEAQLFYASADMTQLAVAAGTTLPNFTITPEDLPAPVGFMVFAGVIGSYVNADLPDEPQRIPIVAVSWGPSGFTSNLPHGGLWLTFWTGPDHEFFRAHIAKENWPNPEEAFRQMIQAHGPMLWDNESVWPYSGVDAEPDEDQLTTAGWMQSVRAAWLLMSQPKVSEVTEIPRARPGRKRDARDGLNAAPVRLLHLRRATREQGAPDGDHAASDYTCRWMVSGHWREHWYPKRQVHRPMWIAPPYQGPGGQAPADPGDRAHLGPLTQLRRWRSRHSVTVDTLTPGALRRAHAGDRDARRTGCWADHVGRPGCPAVPSGRPPHRWFAPRTGRCTDRLPGPPARPGHRGRSPPATSA